MTGQRVPSAVLRNKGVPVEAAIVEENKRLLADDEGPRTQTMWVRFDANAMADLEDHYGSLDAFDAQARKTPTACLRNALAIVWNVPPRTAGLMMLDGKQDDYAAAISVALALANGVDPQQASDLLEEGVKMVSEAKQMRSDAVKKMVQHERDERAKQAEEMAASLGTNGSEPGSASDMRPITSGA